MPLEFSSFVRKPFVIEAVEVTEENIAEVAELVGTLNHNGDGSSFILVDRTKVPTIVRVFPGFWVTKINGNVRCYSKKTFNNHFVRTTPEIQDWVDRMDRETEERAVG